MSKFFMNIDCLASIFSLGLH